MKGRNIADILYRRSIIRFILVFSFFLFFITLYFTDVGEPEPSVFWYMSELFWTYWIGVLLSISVVLLSIKNRTNLEGLAAVFVIVLYIYTLPNYVHEMVVVFDVYHVIPPALEIIDQAAVNLNRIEFPLSHIYFASNLMITDLDGLGYARLFPTILSASIVLFIYALSRRISKSWALITPLVFLSLNWYMEYHMCRQAFGVLLWTAFWLTFYLFVEKKEYRLGALAIILLISLIPSHPGILIIVTFNLVVLSFIILLSYRNKDEWNFLKTGIPVILIFTLSFFILFEFVPNINQFITTLYDRVIQGGFQGFSLGGPSQTSMQYAWVNRLRMSMGIFQSLFGLIGFYLLYRSESKRALFLGSWFLSCYLWLFYSFTHNGFLVERAFLTALIPASILIPPVIERISDVEIKQLFRTIAIVVMIFFLLTIPITKNSVDTFETPTRQAFDAGRFSQDNLEERVFITDTHQGLFRYLESTYDSSVYFRARSVRYIDNPNQGMTFGYPIPATDRSALPKILFVDYINNYFEVRYGDEEVVRDIERYESEVNYVSSRIYDGGGARIYLNIS